MVFSLVNAEVKLKEIKIVVRDIIFFIKKLHVKFYVNQIELFDFILFKMIMIEKQIYNFLF